MHKKYIMAVVFLTVLLCLLLGCRKKSQEEALLLSPLTDQDSQEEVQVQEEETVVVQAGGEAPAAEEPLIVVHICGAVQQPGVYFFPQGSRIYEALEAAGGFCQDAEEEYLNQAQPLSDGMRLYVPARGELDNAQGPRFQELEQQEAGKTNPLAAEGGLVNINTASQEILQTLPGIGSLKAQNIITYREKNGTFQKIEDIMRVEGIKEGLFVKIKDSITV